METLRLHTNVHVSQIAPTVCTSGTNHKHRVQTGDLNVPVRKPACFEPAVMLAVPLFPLYVLFISLSEQQHFLPM